MDPLKTSPPLQDEGILLAIRSGGSPGDQAIMTLYGLYVNEISNRISRFLRQHPGCLADPQDIVHDAFIVMLHKIRYQDPVITSIKAYWLGIARHLWLNEIKKNKKTCFVEDAPFLYGYEDFSPENILLSAEWYQQLEKCMTKCGGRCKDILLLWMANYSMEEISAKLNLSGPLMARKLKYQCFKKLKILVKRNHELMP